MVSSLIAASSGDVQKDPREKKMYGILYVSNKIQRVEKETREKVVNYVTALNNKIVATIIS
jgi:hypothetical protein